MAEVVAIHLGTSGARLGSAVWDLLGTEQMDEGHEKFFREDSVTGEFIPRSILVDSDPDSLQYEKTVGSAYIGKEDFSGCFARGYSDKTVESATLELIRQQMEHTDSCQGFMLFNSIYGGTGSFLSQRVAQHIPDLYPGTDVISFSLFPPCTGTDAIFRESQLVPYNTILQMGNMLKLSRQWPQFMFDNPAITRLCHLNGLVTPNECSVYHTINSILAQQVTTTLSGLVGSCMYQNIREICGRTIPHPNLKYLSCALTPWTSNTISHKPPGNDYQQEYLYEASRNSAGPKGLLNSVSLKSGRLAAWVTYFRGYVIPKFANVALNILRPEFRPLCAPSIPFSMFCGIHYHGPAALPDHIFAQQPFQISTVFNTTAFAELVSANLFKFRSMYRRKAFLQWFEREGMQFDDFQEAENEVVTYLDTCNELNSEFEDDEG